MSRNWHLAQLAQLIMPSRVGLAFGIWHFPLGNAMPCQGHLPPFKNQRLLANHLCQNCEDPKLTAELRRVARGSSPFRDLTHKRFGRLVCIGFSGRQHELKAHRALWRCRCDCGREKVIRADALLSGSTKSCGCYLSELRRLQMKALHSIKVPL